MKAGVCFERAPVRPPQPRRRRRRLPLFTTTAESTTAPAIITVATVMQSHCQLNRRLYIYTRIALIACAFTDFDDCSCIHLLMHTFYFSRDKMRSDFRCLEQLWRESCNNRTSVKRTSSGLSLRFGMNRFLLATRSSQNNARKNWQLAMCTTTLDPRSSRCHYNVILMYQPDEPGRVQH